MAASWSPSARWRRWDGVALGFGPPDAWLTPLVVDGVTRVFGVGPDGVPSEAVLQPDGSWSTWWPFGGGSAGPGAAAPPGAPIHAASCTPAWVDVFCSN